MNRAQTLYPAPRNFEPHYTRQGERLENNSRMYIEWDEDVLFEIALSMHPLPYRFEYTDELALEE